MRRSQAEWPFVHAGEMAYLKLRAAYDDGALVGWGNALRGKWFPPGIAMVNVSVARQHERQGVGGALYRALLAALPSEVETIGLAVDDTDAESLAIARAHGFEVTQHGIESELALTDLPEPQPGAGVTLEDVSSLEFPDEEAVGRDASRQPDQSRGRRGLREHARHLPRDRREGGARGRCPRAGRRRAGRTHRRRGRQRRAQHRLHRRGAGPTVAGTWRSRSSSTATASPPTPARRSRTP